MKMSKSLREAVSRLTGTSYIERRAEEVIRAVSRTRDELDQANHTLMTLLAMRDDWVSTRRVAPPQYGDKDTRVVLIHWIQSLMHQVKTLGQTQTELREELTDARQQAESLERHLDELERENAELRAEARRAEAKVPKEPESEPEPLIDPDCRDGKCGSCIGGPCEHHCHEEKIDGT